MKKKFAFFLMVPECEGFECRNVFETNERIYYFYTMDCLETAIELATKCEKEGFGAIEVCGAFQGEGADKLIKATHGNVAFGYVTCRPDQVDAFNCFFGSN